ncbi:MAG: N-6 DNA methylase [Thermoleophilia bacterium]|nr:N-6 DNA methylase [Thermoleophilia bacterium]
MPRPRHRDGFTTIRTEGAILPRDLLARVAALDKDLGGLIPDDYHLSGEKLNEATNRAWNRLQGAWAAFGDETAALRDGRRPDPGTTPTREKWLLPLFQELGYGRLATAKAQEIDGRSYAVSHGWAHVPIHLVGLNVDLDRRMPGVAGAAQASPHSLLQEFLNRSDEHLWGFVSNGLELRILRDNRSLTRQAFVEFDLEAMMTGEAYADFALLYLLCHESRVEAERPEECWLERWSRAAEAQGTRALDQLRKGVEESITALGTGFLAHPANIELRQKLQDGALPTQDYYRDLLRLVYRLLFIFVAEDRGLLLDPGASPETKDLYTRFYSTARLRRLAERRRGGRHTDLYQGLRLILGKLGEDGGCPEIALPALGSFLFADQGPAALGTLEIANRDFLTAVRSLASTSDGKVRRAVDYRNLGSEELGSVYEALLELHPEVNVAARTFALRSAGGSERKTTGSYYTPTSLIQCLLDSALEPVVTDALRAPDPEAALLALRVCDPACGSGHFLVAAAHRLAKRLAAARTGDEEPSPEAQRTALRDVIGHCLYGVDLNPMAVELCKVSLWMEALEPGKPLSFLDHRILSGNSLLGATPALLAAGVPDEAFKPLEGDDKQVVSALRKQNKKERAGQTTLFAGSLPALDTSALAETVAGIDRLADDSPAGVHAKEERYRGLAASPEYRRAKLAADALCAAFVCRKAKGAPAVTHDVFLRLAEDPDSVPTPLRAEVERLADQYRFFHWQLAFPDVFRTAAGDDRAENEHTGWSGGFDVVLGNPPWEKLTISEEEWFAGRHPEIAETKGKARRDVLIRDLALSDLVLWTEWLAARRMAEAHALLMSRGAGRYPLTGSGELNTYHLFTELADQLVASDGRVGLIVKTGIGSANNCLPLIKKITDARQLVSLFDFVNTKGLFPAVQTVERFSLLTYAGVGGSREPIRLATLCQEPADLAKPGRQYTLSPEDVALMSPYNGAMPLLKGDRDAAIIRRIYSEFPVLGDRDSTRPRDLWNVDYVRIFDMAIDSKHFRRREDLEALGLEMNERRHFIGGDEEYWPLNEGKYVYLMDHRYGTFENVPTSQRYGRKATAPTPSAQQLADPHYEIMPRYWFPKSLWDERRVEKGLRSDYQFHFRDVAGVYPDLRTAIGAICPAGPAGDKAPTLTLPPGGDPAEESRRYLAFAGLFCSLPFDYVVRNKLFSKSLKFNTLGQIPMPPPSLIEVHCEHVAVLVDRLVATALELTFTTWTLAPLGAALRVDEPLVWDERRRFGLLREVDAIAAHLYGLTREEFEHVLSTFETLARQEARAHAEYLTAHMALDAFHRLSPPARGGPAEENCAMPADERSSP